MKKDNLKNKCTSLVSRSFVLIIKIYQAALSPIFGGQCRFTPSCSNYAIEAINSFGPFKGGFLAIKRILRCHPFGHKGYDPLPGK